MANVVPGALWRPIDVGNRAARRKGRGLIGHIAVVNSTLLIPGPVSTRPSDWHFYLPKQPYPSGQRFAQLIDLDVQSWSSADANASCAAFESEGGVGADVNGPWTANQVESAAIILAHMHRTEGVPLQDMVNSLPGSRGFGVHRYGIDPYRVAGGEKWSSVYAKACPGDARVKQIPAIVARAQQLVNGDSDVLTDDDITKLWYGPRFRGDQNYAQVIQAMQDGINAIARQTQALDLSGRPGGATDDQYGHILSLRAEVEALTAKVNGGTAAASGPVQISAADRAAIVKDILDGLKGRLES